MEAIQRAWVNPESAANQELFVRPKEGFGPSTFVLFKQMSCFMSCIFLEADKLSQGNTNRINARLPLVCSMGASLL